MTAWDNLTNQAEQRKHAPPPPIVPEPLMEPAVKSEPSETLRPPSPPAPTPVIQLKAPPKKGPGRVKPGPKASTPLSAPVQPSGPAHTPALETTPVPTLATVLAPAPPSAPIFIPDSAPVPVVPVLVAAPASPPTSSPAPTPDLAVVPATAASPTPSALRSAPSLKLKFSKDPPTDSPLKNGASPIRNKPKLVVASKEKPAPGAKTKGSPAPSVDDWLEQELAEIEAQAAQNKVSNGKKKSKDKPVIPAVKPDDVNIGSSTSPPVTLAPPKRPKKQASVASPKAKFRELSTTPSKTSTAIDVRKCKELLKHITDLSKVPEAWLFLIPVDPVAAGCPTYVFRATSHL